MLYVAFHNYPPPCTQRFILDHLYFPNYSPWWLQFVWIRCLPLRVPPRSLIRPFFLYRKTEALDLLRGLFLILLRNNRGNLQIILSLIIEATRICGYRRKLYMFICLTVWEICSFLSCLRQFSYEFLCFEPSKDFDLFDSGLKNKFYCFFQGEHFQELSLPPLF